MDLYLIDDAIEELEQAETNFANCERLADLYIIKEHFKKYPPVLRGLYDSVESELNDIAPQYKKFVETKRQYQLGNATKESVLASMNLVSEEISQFIKILYSSTDTKEEREIIRKMVYDLSRTYSK